MGMAADDGLIAANPCLRVKHLSVAAREMDFLRHEEIPRDGGTTGGEGRVVPLAAASGR
jgi:hypothetical protein